MSSLHGHALIPGSPDLSRPSLPGHSRTSSVRPSGSRPSQCSPSHFELELIPHVDAHNAPCTENEALITPSHGSRPARHSTLSPGPHSLPITPHSAISDPYLPYSTDHHVLLVQDALNQRLISHHPNLSPIPGHHVSVPTVLESFELSTPSTRHAAINSRSTRPRTSNQVFNNISDLASHYGIPQFLPSAPRTIPHRTEIEAFSSSQPAESFLSSPDFESLRSNYLTMLSQQPGDHGANDAPAGSSASEPTIQVSDADAVRSLMDVLNATPDLQMSSDLNEFLTSPLIGSPLDDELLATPAVGSDIIADILTSPLMGDFGGNDSFGDFSFGVDFEDTMLEGSKPQNGTLAVPHLLYSIESPNTPVVDSPFSLPPKTDPSKRKSTVTGTRKNITPESLVPINAPIQSRKYLTPSSTSRKELPATWRRKRLRTSSANGEVDQLADECPTPTPSEQEQIDAKRRQNTIAARRSRKRKLEYQQELEDNLERSQRDCEMWRQRALTYKALLCSHHIECPEFADA